jgi:hypothetical protein
MAGLLDATVVRKESPRGEETSVEELARVRNSDSSHRFSAPRKCGDEFAPATSGAIFLSPHVFKSVSTRLGAPKGFPLVDGSDEHMGCYGTCGRALF